ncbi:MAG: tetraacyldisaccharide 4'-kinase [Syntrophobacterales bacterium]|jgi:tetraacyldisaccharide 4'-kinase|nr:tetraacyldisaccharide 4'-kinase [Syntrophobacterales bacterium]
MRNIIIRIWNGESKHTKWLLYVPLFLLSKVYKVCLDARRRIYDLGWVPVVGVAIPVISVGNVTLGGTGKTPVVEKISVMLKEAGFRPAIATRGYKRKKKGTFLVDTKRDTAHDVGDEAYMLARNTQVPVLVGSNRAEAIDMGMKMFPIDLAVLDDGFQLKNIEKDIEVLVLNGSEGKFSRGLFPLGPYREPLERIRDADIILVNKGDLDEDMRAYTDEIPTYRMRYKPAYLYNMKFDGIVHYDFLKGKRVAAFAGLGDNRSFFNLLSDLGADVVYETCYPDHHGYTEVEVKRIASYGGIDLVVTTEKDAVKIMAMEVPDNFFYLAVTIQIEREQELFELIQNKLKREIWQRESFYSIRH